MCSLNRMRPLAAGLDCFDARARARASARDQERAKASNSENEWLARTHRERERYIDREREGDQAQGTPHHAAAFVSENGCC